MASWRPHFSWGGGRLLTNSASAVSGSSRPVNVNASVATFCSLSSTEETIEKTIQPGIPDTIGTAHIKAVCNDPAGIAIYAVGYTNNEYGNTALSAGSASYYNIPTDVVANPTNSQWNMIIRNDTSVQENKDVEVVSGFGSQHVIPSIYTKVAYRNSAANGSIGANFTAQFDIYASERQPAGTYDGKVKFLLIHPNVLAYEENPSTHEMEPSIVAPSTIAHDPETVHYLQDVAEWGSSVGVGKANAVTAYDARDNQAYTVTRYNMGGGQTALWMSNLNLGASDFIVSTLDGFNTHLPTDGSKDIAISDFLKWERGSAGGADSSYSYTDPKFTIQTTTDSYGNKYGTLYNYAATSANTYTYAEGAAPEGVNAQYDLCPAGWRLPTGGSTGEFQKLYDANGLTSDAAGSTSLQNDFGFSLAGYFIDSTPVNQGSNGRYWSSTRYNGYNMYRLYFDASGISPAGIVDRNGGFSVRCVAL